MKRSRRTFALLALILAGATAALFTPNVLRAQAPAGGDRGRIDYDKGMVYATGLGAVSQQEPNQAKAYLKARGFAKLDALRNLLMLVDKVSIDSQTVGADFEADDRIRAEVKGIVHGAQIMSERQVPVGTDMMIEVTVAAPLFGRQSVASVFLPEIARRNMEAADIRGHRDLGIAPVQIPDVVARQHEPPHGLKAGDTRYTGLIVDTRGLKIDRSMAPKIRREDGSEVWGSVNVSDDFVIEHGIVIYAHSVDEAAAEKRAGNNPLVVSAVGRAGGEFHSDAVLTAADAETVMEANKKHGFMDHFNVVFVVDEGH